MVEPLKIEPRLVNINKKNTALMIPDYYVSGTDVRNNDYYREVQINAVMEREVYIAILESGKVAINIIISRKDFVDGLKMIFPELK